MRLKTFQAKTMSDAMRQIKDALGDDAIIVSSKDSPGGWIRVTAAVDEEFAAAPVFEKPIFTKTPMPSPKRAVEKPVEKPIERQTPAQDLKAYAQKVKQAASAPIGDFDEEDIVEMIMDLMLKHRVPASTSEKIVSAATVQAGRDPRRTLTKSLERVFDFAPVAQRQAEPILLVGPPGAGKTLMTAKLATRAVMAGHMPAVITTDIARAGGIEQLSAFLDILELPLLQAEDGKSLKAVLTKAADAPLIIIDTGGLNPFDPNEMKTLAKLIAVDTMDTALVLPAGIDAEESAEMAMTFEILGVKRIIPTRLDFARRIGGILSAADRGGLAFGQASHTPQVANGILDVTAASLAEFLMPVVPTGTAGKKR